MLEDNDFDKLFKDGLNDLKSVDNKDKQWEVVSQRLQKKSRKIGFWLLPLFALVAFISLFLINSHNSTSENKIALEHIGSKEGNAASKEELSIQNENIELHDVKDIRNLTSEISNEVTQQVTALKNKKALDTKYQNRPTFKNSSKSDSKHKEESTIKETKTIEHKPSFGAHHFDYSNDYNSSTKSVINNTIDKRQNMYNLQEKTNSQTQAIQEDRESLTFPLLNTSLLLPSILERPEMQIKPIEVFKQKKSLKFRIGAGLFQEVITQDSLNDYSNLGYQTSLGLNYSRMHINLGYKNNKVSRVISSGYESYNVVDTSIIYGYSRPDSASVAYTNHIFDLTFGYNISPIKWLDWNIQVGVLAQYLKNGELKYTYGGVYETIVNKYTFENQGLQITDLLIGTGLNFNIYKGIGLSFEYNLLIPQERETIKWPMRHQFDLGLFYNLN